MTPKTAPSTPTAVAGRLASHRHIQFLGNDAASFLQGYLTCDTAELSVREARPGAFTNLKGRVVASGWFWGHATEVHALVVADVAPLLLDFLAPYMNFARTNAQLLDNPPCIALRDLPPVDGTAQSQEVTLGESRWWLPPDEHLTDDLSQAWLADCIATSEAVIGAEVSGAHLPQMLGLVELGAVSFEKGCYLGQEVVARAQHRGEVKRRLRRVTFAAGPALFPGMDLTTPEGKKAAAVVCANDSAALVVTSVDAEGSLKWLAGEEQAAFQLDPLPDLD